MRACPAGRARCGPGFAVGSLGGRCGVTGLPAVLVDLPEPGADAEMLARLAARLGHAFARPGLLRAALTLPAWVNEHPRAGWPGHACLEFLGDAVLDLVTADALWRRFPDLSEGTLTRLQASVVSEAALAEAASAFGLGESLFAGRGDRRDGTLRPTLLADAVEAVIAAAFLDARAAGRDPLAAAGGVVDVLLGAKIAALRPDDGVDAKSKLQQVLQASHGRAPTYAPVGARPTGQDPTWRAEVRLTAPDGQVEVLGEGVGASLRAAEQAAAAAALARLKQGAS